ncbi:MAG: hypothetical protein KTR31_23100, partial [Myxococcales bacterium]|nr:hypothetical protein [Myxococcales bacterium]
MLDGIGDYSAREQVTERIGASCSDPTVLAFVRNLHDTLKDRAFVSWAGAVETCDASEIVADLETWAADPPTLKFDNKYAKVVELYGQRTGAAGLPLLSNAAIAASTEGGPFSAVLDAMVKAVTPEGLGSKPEGASANALADALLTVAAGVGDEDVGRVGDSLLSVGATTAAATLRPRLHPGLQQGDGSFLYGLAAVESCNEVAVVHWAVVADGGDRWDVLPDAQPVAEGFKRKLKGCNDPLSVSTTPQPIRGSSEAERFAEAAAEASGASSVKLKSQKRIELGAS